MSHYPEELNNCNNETGSNYTVIDGIFFSVFQIISQIEPQILKLFIYDLLLLIVADGGHLHILTNTIFL